MHRSRRSHAPRPACTGAFAALVLVISVSGGAFAAGRAAMPPAPPARVAATARPAVATFAGGCFWCIETAFEGMPGVKSVVSGYTGGFKLDPTYDEVSAGKTGHAESVQIAYDPRVTSYEKLLDVFWHNVDPTQADGQFCDHGTQYRSAIFYGNEAEKRAAEASRQRVAAQLRKAIVTEIVAASRFYAAEDYHQDFYKKNPVRYWSYRTGCGRDARLKQIWGKAPATAH